MGNGGDRARGHRYEKVAVFMGSSFQEFRQAATSVLGTKKVRQDSNKKLPLVGLVNIVTVRDGYADSVRALYAG